MEGGGALSTLLWLRQELPGSRNRCCGSLKENGWMIIPIGGNASQQMTVFHREGDDFKKELFQYFTFVPLVGREGWDDTCFLTTFNEGMIYGCNVQLAG